jgi:serine/threonine protein kinase/Tfp pilus assembly protein PilF
MKSQGVLVHDRSATRWVAESARHTPNRVLVAEFKSLWAQGAGDARDFLSGHPELTADKSMVLDLAYEEYCLRREAGESPDADEFCRRFPAFKSSLRQLIETHRLLTASVSLAAEGLPASWPQAGESFMGFSLERELGRGTFARVFLATEPALGDRPVAVKISFEETAEAKTLGRLRHANIVPVHSVQKDHHLGAIAVCMPYLGSATLCDVIDRVFGRGGSPTSARILVEAARDLTVAVDLIADRQPPNRLLRHGTYVDGVVCWAAQLADALVHAHAQRIYHGDLKPSNVLVTPDGKPMLLDFNLSFNERLPNHQLGGTLPYMAPEQLRATVSECEEDPALVGDRTDVFSLGIIVYQLLTGAHPFGPISSKLSPAQVREYLLERHAAGPLSVRQANPQVDPSLAQIVERCLTFDPKDRFPSAAELASALRKSVAPARRARRWVARHTWTLVATSFLLLMTGVAAAVAWSLRDPPHLEPTKSGLEAYERQDYPEAIKQFKRAVEAAPENPWIWFARGRAYQQLAIAGWIKRENTEALFRQALNDYEKAIERTNDWRIMVCIGVCNQFLPYHPKAIDAYKRAMEEGFVTAEVWNNLGYSYLEKGTSADYDEAQTCLDQAIILNPKLVSAYHNRAWLGFQQYCQSRGKDHKFLEDMIANICEAVQRSEPGPETAELYADAARIYARAVRRGNNWWISKIQWIWNAQRIARAKAMYSLAIEHGQDPKKLGNDLSSFSHYPQLIAFSKKHQPGTTLRVLRILDPLPGIPAELLLRR